MQIKSKIHNFDVNWYRVAQSRIPNITICIVLCAISLVIILLFATSLLVCRSDKPISIEENLYKQTDSYNFVSYISSTVAIGSHLLTVSKNQKQVNITSTDETYRQCHLTIEENFAEDISGAALGNKIVIWSASKRQGFLVSGHIKYTLLLIDPHQCSYKALPTIKDRWPLSQLVFLPAVLTYQDSLEIFFPSQTICFPCRFDINGSEIELNHQIQSEGYRPFQTYHIQMIDRPGRNRSYVYTLQYESSKSVMRLLDQDFKVIKQIRLKHAVDMVAVGSVSTNTSYIGVFYAEPNRQRFAYYRLIDAELKSMFKVGIPLSKDHSVTIVSMAIGSSGSSYLTLVEGLRSNTGRSIYLVRYDATGRMMSKIEFGVLGDYKNYEVQAMLLEDQRYCLVLREVNGDKAGVTDITCYNVEEMVLHRRD